MRSQKRVNKEQTGQSSGQAKKQTNKRKISLPNPIPLTKDYNTKVLRNELKILHLLFTAHQTDFNTLETKYNSLQSSYNAIAKVLFSSINTTKDLLALIRCMEQGEEWKPQHKEIQKVTRLKINLN